LAAQIIGRVPAVPRKIPGPTSPRPPALLHSCTFAFAPTPPIMMQMQNRQASGASTSARCSGAAYRLPSGRVVSPRRGSVASNAERALAGVAAQRLSAAVAGKKAARSLTVLAAAIRDGQPLEGRKLRVAVIGGGPAGACAAETLAQGGVDVTLIERKMDNCKVRWLLCGRARSTARPGRQKSAGAVRDLAFPGPDASLHRACGAGGTPACSASASLVARARGQRSACPASTLAALGRHLGGGPRLHLEGRAAPWDPPPFSTAPTCSPAPPPNPPAHTQPPPRPAADRRPLLPPAAPCSPAVAPSLCAWWRSLTCPWRSLTARSPR